MRGAVIVFAAVLAASGCVGQIHDTSPAAPGTDAGTSATPDAGPIGVRDCTQPGACPCTTSYECQTGFTCLYESETRVYCAPGTRGTGRLGQACPNGGRDCLSGVCVTPANGPPVCTDRCDVTECDGTTLPTCTELNVDPIAKLCL